MIKENRELYTFLTKGEEGLTIYNMTENNPERDKSDQETVCNFDIDIMHVLDKEVVYVEDFG